MTTRRPGGACIVELPAGYRDDPAGQAGLAALLGAVMADPRCGGVPERVATHGWRTRHRLEARHSSFAYWSSDPADLASILEHFRRTRLPAGTAGEALLDAMRARQVAATEHRGATPLTLIGSVLERAARGTPTHASLGIPETIAAVTPADLAETLDRLGPAAVVYDDEPDSGGLVPAAGADPGPPWRGGLDLTSLSASEAQVGVRLPIHDAPPEVLETMVEVLGNGPDGRLHHAVRHQHHLAYGFTAAGWPQPGSASIGVTATVPPQHAAAAVRVLVATVRRLTEGAGSQEAALARWRCRARLLTELDGPFGLVDERHRRAHGRRSGEERLAELTRADELPGLSFATLRPAVAAIGPLKAQHREEIELAYQEVCP